MKSSLQDHYIHFMPDLGARVIEAGDAFWDQLARGAFPELDSGRLMVEFAFSEPWKVWEMHPHGEELVLLLSGSATLFCEVESKVQSYCLERTGEYVLVPKGAWHTADTDAQTRMLFLTPGKDTQHRPR